ncbi:hypothetical protein KIPB_000727 [Kipferlia bialata]|uniref:SET domain-containing protein n=1 Tax=Kipferlia bialata TaxID=797122 RepID=A0A9K3GER7_9EUKA|nr:hypothetical protein KIPB_000727 [Kipferlia bialata]|eukprot:g727.t1
MEGMDAASLKLILEIQRADRYSRGRTRRHAKPYWEREEPSAEDSIPEVEETPQATSKKLSHRQTLARAPPAKSSKTPAVKRRKPKKAPVKKRPANKPPTVTVLPESEDTDLEYSISTPSIPEADSSASPAFAPLSHSPSRSESSVSQSLPRAPVNVVEALRRVPVKDLLDRKRLNFLPRLTPPPPSYYCIPGAHLMLRNQQLIAESLRRQPNPVTNPFQSPAKAVSAPVYPATCYDGHPKAVPMVHNDYAGCIPSQTCGRTTTVQDHPRDIPALLDCHRTLTQRALLSTLVVRNCLDGAMDVVDTKHRFNPPVMYRHEEGIAVARSGIAGFGVFALAPIPKNTLLCEYSGDMYSEGLGDALEHCYHNIVGINSTYMFRTPSRALIDATMSGNEARFINHSCQPCARSRNLFRDYVGIYSEEPIEAGAEITYDYKVSSDAPELREKCYCGTPNCRQWL